VYTFSPHPLISILKVQSRFAHVVGCKAEIRALEQTLVRLTDRYSHAGVESLLGRLGSALHDVSSIILGLFSFSRFRHMATVGVQHIPKS
jgi:hypothetical protein